MPDLEDGQSFEMQGSASRPYIIKNIGGVYSCTCPAWRNQSLPPERRTCKHIRKLRGDAAEEARLNSPLPTRAVTAGAGDEEGPGGPPLLLAETWLNDLDLAGWWMSEKLDGVRAYWDGKMFISRAGNQFLAPDWFLEGLPDVPLDGELWIDRKRFQQTVSVVRRMDRGEAWREVRYVVFDAPAVGGEFETRIMFVQDHVRRKKPKFAVAHEHVLCKGLDHLRQELARVETLGGEGLMLRQPRSKYEAGRSSTLLKVKRFHDAEAKVVAHQPGEGKHTGRMGSLLVELGNGTRFSVGTGFSDKDRANPPPVGSVITFRYQELTDAGVPRFPSFVGVRTDVPGPKTSHPAAPKHAPARTAGSLAPIKGSTTAVPKPSAVKPPAFVPGTPRHFEYIEGASRKFWEVEVNGAEVTTRWGRIGTDGRSTTKSFADDAAALKAAEKMVDEKTEEGYVEI